MNMNQKFSARNLALNGMFTAVAVITSLISLPLPGGVALTLQTFGMALIGYVLGPSGVWAVLVWILLGAVGLPVFSGFRSGAEALFGPSGGFIFGFPFMTFLCGLGSRQRHLPAALLSGLAGLLVLHLLGILHYARLSGLDFWASALIMSVPFLIKDVCSVVLALAAGKSMRRRLPAEAVAPSDRL